MAITLTNLSADMLRFVLVNDLDANKDGTLSADEERGIDALIGKQPASSEKRENLIELKAALRAPGHVPRTVSDATLIARAIAGDAAASAAVDPKAMREQEKLSLIGTLSRQEQCTGVVAKTLMLSVGEERWNDFRALGLRQGDCPDLFRTASTHESPAELAAKRRAAVHRAVLAVVADFRKYQGSSERSGWVSGNRRYAEGLVLQHLGAVDVPPGFLRSFLLYEIDAITPTRDTPHRDRYPLEEYVIPALRNYRPTP